LLSTNRFNAVAQEALQPTTTVTTTNTWSNILTATFTVTFASDLAIRAYFNAGGQFSVIASHDAGVGTSINQFINDLCADLGTITFSAPSSGTASIVGIPYSGVTQTVAPGYPAGSTITTTANNGFYSLLTPAPVELVKQLSNYDPASHYGSAYGPTSFISVSASYNGSGILTFTVVIDEVPNGATVSIGTDISLTTKPPSTATLTDTWGTPTVTSSVTAV
jgi:hypothetical protein